VSQDERVATMIREALEASIAVRDDDPGAVDRVSLGIGAALGSRFENPRDRAAQPPDRDGSAESDHAAGGESASR